MKKLLIALAAILALTLALSACTPAAHAPSEDGLAAQPGNGAVGTLLLSLNPEIEIEYNKEGLVVEIEGKNQDGKELLLTYKDFEGKEVKQAMAELVEAIYASGKFELKLEGNDKNIVVKLEEGSAYPDEKFLEEVAAAIRQVVAQQGKQSETVVVDQKDLNSKGLIGLEKAKELVLAQLGLDEADFVRKDYELDDGIYELEFTVGNTEYEYEVDGYTGKILKADVEHNDDWNQQPAEPPVSPAITLEEAKAIAFAHLGITEADTYNREYELDKGIYELSFHVGNTEYDVDIDAATGEILRADQEVENDRYDGDRNDDVPTGTTGITLEEAKAIAFAHLGITEADTHDRDYDLENGRYELSFHVGSTEYEIKIDAATGEVLRVDQETENRWDDDDDWDDQDDIPPSTSITLEEAKAIAFKHLGITEADTHDRDYEFDNGRYELSFNVGRTEYEIAVSTTGEILYVEKEIDD